MRALKAYRVLKHAGINPRDIEWLMRRIHVGETDADVRGDIIRRTRRPGWTLPLREAAVAYALHCHRHNGREYRRAMWGAR